MEDVETAVVEVVPAAAELVADVAGATSTGIKKQGGYSASFFLFAFFSGVFSGFSAFATTLSLFSGSEM